MSAPRRQRRRPPTCDLHVDDVLEAQAECRVTEIRSVAPALVLVLERDAPPRFQLAGVETRGDMIALQSFLDSDELALAVRSEFYAHSNDDPLVHERRGSYTERLSQGITADPVTAKEITR